MILLTIPWLCYYIHLYRKHAIHNCGSQVDHNSLFSSLHITPHFLSTCHLHSQPPYLISMFRNSRSFKYSPFSIIFRLLDKHASIITKSTSIQRPNQRMASDILRRYSTHLQLISSPSRISRLSAVGTVTSEYNKLVSYGKRSFNSNLI